MRFSVLGLVLAGSAIMISGAVPDARQYNGISSRNVFGLRAPESIPAPEPPPVNGPPIYLTGITTMLGYKQALLRIQAPAKPGQPAREESLILAEGQRENGIEVLRINEDSGQVSILNGATRMTLDFERNGIQAKGSPGSPMVLAQNRGATNPTTYRLLPSRMPRGGRVSATNAIAAPIPSPVGYSTPYLYSQTNPPTGSVTGNIAAGAGLPVPTQTTSSTLSLTPQDQVVLSELERAAAMESIRQQNQNSGTLPATGYPPMPDPAIPGSMGSAVPPFPPVNGY